MFLSEQNEVDQNSIMNQAVEFEETLEKLQNKSRFLC